MPPGAELITADMAVAAIADQVIRHVQPTLIVNAAAAVDLDVLEAEQERAERLNAQLPGILGTASRSVSARLVHVSTDAVFDGQIDRPYQEDDAPRPINVYGASKRRGELAVAAANPAALIVRTTIYGWNATSKMSLAEWFLDRLAADAGVSGFVDAWFAPVNTAHLAEALLTCLEANAWPPPEAVGQVLHLAGGECVTKYDFGRRLAAMFDFNPDVIRPGHLADQPFLAKRAGRACLDSSRARSVIGRAAPTVDAGLARFREDRDLGRRRALKAMGAGE